MPCIAPPTLPKYSDDEVSVFHPYLETALKCAIDELGEADLEVLHHEYIGKIEADLIVRRRSTGRFVLFIEVKRLPGDISSTRNKLQAQSYVTEALASGPAKVERQYYVLTNIEIFEAFKYSPAQPAVDQQILNTSPLTSGRFSDNPTAFFRVVVENCKILLTTALVDTGVYRPTSQRLDFLLESRKATPTGWHETLLLAGYEYIRGSLNPPGWVEGLLHQGDPSRLLAIGAALDFSGIFSDPLPLTGDPDIWHQPLLNEIFTNGKIRRTGEDISQSAYNLISEGRSQEGLVPTDLELARLLSSLVRHVFGRELADGEVICDPAAGTGSLLGAIPYSFVTVQPTQIWGNERESQMIEPLSLVLGLLFSAVVTPVNSPKVTATDVIDLDPADFENVSVILMNPPFRSGITSVQEKARFAERIFALTDAASHLNIGQAGFESVFLELIYHLVSDGTVIGMVAPQQILTGSGKEAQLFRRFLIERFGLEVIATYPRTDLFDSVTKGTCLIVGRKNRASDEVISVQVKRPLTNIDLGNLAWKHIAQTKEGSLGYGVSYSRLSANLLRKKFKSGWRFTLPMGFLVQAWIDKELMPICKLLGDNFQTRKGRLGNQGASDLIFPDSNKGVWTVLKDLIPSVWLSPALRRVDAVNSPNVELKLCRVRALTAPPIAYKKGTKENAKMLSIVAKYEANVIEKKGGQKKEKKTKQDLLNISAKTTSRFSKLWTVWIPRNTRRHARSFIINDNVYVATNVVEVSGGTKVSQQLLHSWTLTVFSNLQFESLAKDQEGARKLEKEPVKALLIPDFANLSEDSKTQILDVYEKTTSFTDLYNPTITELDKIWAKLLWGERAELVLNQALTLLKDMVFERDPH